MWAQSASSNLQAFRCLTGPWGSLSRPTSPALMLTLFPWTTVMPSKGIRLPQFGALLDIYFLQNGKCNSAPGACSPLPPRPRAPPATPLHPAACLLSPPTSGYFWSPRLCSYSFPPANHFAQPSHIFPNSASALCLHKLLWTWAGAGWCPPRPPSGFEPSPSY